MKITIKFFVALLALLVATEAGAGGLAQIGGSMVESTDSTNLSANIRQHWENDEWQYDVDGTYNFQKSSGEQTTNKYYTSGKVNYNLSSEYYVFALASIDNDKFRLDEQRIIFGTGLGYKILRTKHFKISNEFSVAELETDFETGSIWRNSLWIRYDASPTVIVTNKYLVEDGNYARNQTSVEYKFENGVTVGVGNLYTKDDYLSDNISTFNIGYQW
jgi:putative salt-induced outer membrane protein YdiY